MPRTFIFILIPFILLVACGVAPTEPPVSPMPTITPSVLAPTATPSQAIIAASPTPARTSPGETSLPQLFAGVQNESFATATVAPSPTSTSRPAFTVTRPAVPAATRAPFPPTETLTDIDRSNELRPGTRTPLPPTETLVPPVALKLYGGATQIDYTDGVAKQLWGDRVIGVHDVPIYTLPYGNQSIALLLEGKPTGGGVGHYSAYFVEITSVSDIPISSNGKQVLVVEYRAKNNFGKDVSGRYSVDINSEVWVLGSYYSRLYPNEPIGYDSTAKISPGLIRKGQIIGITNGVLFKMMLDTPESGKVPSGIVTDPTILLVK